VQYSGVLDGLDSEDAHEATVKATATPKRDSTMELADGRTLAWSEWGDPDGRPLVLLHGTPGSRLLCPDEDATEAARVRLITIDRPGYGCSDPQPGLTTLGWVDDYLELVEHLDLPPCPVVGWSGGGAYALACSYRLPERISSVGLAASPGPVTEVPGAFDEFSPEGRANYELFQRDRAAGIEAITRRRASFRGDVWGAFFAGNFPEADAPLLVRPDVQATMRTFLNESARQGPTGWADDDIAEASPLGFSVADIRPEVHIWIGGADAWVSRNHADYMVATIPRATLVSFPGGGHLFPFDRWDEMLPALT
jgi:pimeloyl-ACP methyl ester carboxylesterase